MSKYLLKNLTVMSVAKIGAVLGLIFGLIEGVIIGIVVAVGSSAAIGGLHPLLGMGIGGIVVFFAIVFGLIGGFIGGAIWALIYNVAAFYVGPVELDLEVKA
ncbi:MAG: hypothetical protein ABSE07_12165 [Methanoregula sp.]|jgi:hypothetical protein